VPVIAAAVGAGIELLHLGSYVVQALRAERARTSAPAR
jgi:hypothetical protein